MFGLGLPVFIEDSRVPVFLSYFSPIEIGAITLGPLVFSRGKISERTRRHEAIHWEQYKELGVVLFPVLYFTFWLWNLVKFKDGMRAYYMIPFEREAYVNDKDVGYLFRRKRWAWARSYKKQIV
jgi:hypothetical protein